jgi:hypothetical protein
MTQSPGPESRRLHAVRNHLAVVIGYCDLLLGELRPDDAKYKDLIEMQKAANAALALLEGATEIK